MTLWHQRLGHPADQVLDVLKTALNFNSHSAFDRLCDTCNKTKQTREPFPLCDHKSTKIGHLVHLDVWGPYKVVSRDGFRYFLTIVDDFSRAVWVYMLKGKDDVYDSIVELPLYLWPECILIVVNIINRIPSSVLSGKSPFSFVYGHKPSLSHFRGFGCLCYATILNNQDKFSSRDVKFYETIFPFKLKNNLKEVVFESGITKDVNHINFFDNENPKRSNDDGRVSFYDDGTELSSDYQNDDDSGATSIDENTHPDGNVSDETDPVNNFFKNIKLHSESTDLPVNVVRRSSRQFKLPTSLNDFIVDGKVKLVAKGFSQREGIGFDLDVHNVFLYGDLDEDIYMTIPQGFSDNINKNKVCKLVKSLYGLKQAPKKWNEKLVGVLKEHGFTQSVNDHSVFTKSKNNKFIALLVYVDDIVIASNYVNGID
ncbi:ribonuclease H-like domain-containing protein [Tanacetum coccineum]